MTQKVLGWACTKEELRKLLAPFTDDIPISLVKVTYEIDSDGGSISLVVIKK